MATEKIAQVWPEWEVEKQLGKGSYGVVYKVVRRDNNIQSHAAIKVITIPTDESEVDSLRSEGLSMEGAKTYFQGIVNDFVGEIQLMESLKGVQNIVSVEDYKVVENTEGIGWDIYIRMELLTPFNNYICDRKMTEKEVIKLGIDICTALEICEKRNIVHRDIKPENIFINDFGYFKLGDFGIARKLENATGGLSQKGTFNYMAPEVATGTRYDARVDLYSLGIVLYRLLNANRLPFIENDQQLLNPNARKAAVERRIRGDKLPAPCDASSQMASVILRACAYNPAARFANATEMKEALTKASMGIYQEEVDLDKTVSVRHAATNLDATVYQAPPIPTGTMPGGFRPVSQPVSNTNNSFGSNSRPNAFQNPGQFSAPQFNNTGNQAPQFAAPQFGNQTGNQSGQFNNTANRAPQFNAPQFGNQTGNQSGQFNNTGSRAPQFAAPQFGSQTGNQSGQFNNTASRAPQFTAPQYGNQTGTYGTIRTAQPATGKKKTNLLCILSLLACLLPLVCDILRQNSNMDSDIMLTTGIVSMVFALIPLILAIAGRAKAASTGAKGTGFAVAGMLVGLLFMSGVASDFFRLFAEEWLVEEEMGDVIGAAYIGVVALTSIISFLCAGRKNKNNR